MRILLVESYERSKRYSMGTIVCVCVCVCAVVFVYVYIYYISIYMYLMKLIH
jgi:hypothetical protein